MMEHESRNGKDVAMIGAMSRCDLNPFSYSVNLPKYAHETQEEDHTCAA